EDPGFEFLGFHIRQYRVGKHQSGKRPGGQRLGYKTLIKPAKANIQAHLAELGRIIRRSKALPQGEVIRQLNPVIRGWAHYYRIGVSKAVYARLDSLTWAKLRSWAHRRHPTKTTPWVIQRTGTGWAPASPLPRRLLLLMPGTSISIVRSPSPGISKSEATAVPRMGTGSIGARDRDGTQGSVLDWRHCSNSNVGAVPT